MPGHVRNVGRRMIEGRDLDSFVMRGGQKRVAGTEAGAEDSQLRVSLLLKPIEAAADIEYTLARGVERASYVCRNCVVGALNFCRTANIVIWHAQAQHGNSKPVQRWAKRIVAQRVGVPLGQQYDRTLSFCRKPARVGEIVFRIRRRYGRGESKEMCVLAADLRLQRRIRNSTRTEDLDFPSLQAKVGGRLVRKEFVARRYGSCVVLAQVV